MPIADNLISDYFKKFRLYAPTGTTNTPTEQVEEELILLTDIEEVEEVYDDTDIDSSNWRSQLAFKQIARYGQDTEDRRGLTDWAKTVVSLWMFAVVITLFCNHSHLHLSEGVLVMLLGTTTFNVLGLAYIVLRGHFPVKIK